MLHQILWILLGCGVLSIIVILWFLVYYLFTPHVENPDAKAKITGTCGDTMEIRLKFKGDRVVETSSWTDGCAHSMNSICAAADLAKGKTPDEIIQIDAAMIRESVGGLPSDHLHCAQLAEETLQAAVHNYMLEMKRNTPRNDTPMELPLGET
ncbi:MAG: iron-sulfur cluster assembly scaffold protein [Deltaproteobacteria bacterium]|nr:iron-sulfur cluster assembly scaffold protein [Deltaproteobacteria bacterium]